MLVSAQNLEWKYSYLGSKEDLKIIYSQLICDKTETKAKGQA